jgi:hypothetical protein
LEKLKTSHAIVKRNGILISFMDIPGALANDRKLISAGLSDDGRQKIIDANRGKPKSEEHRAKMKAAAKEKWRRINAALETGSK